MARNQIRHFHNSASIYQILIITFEELFKSWENLNTLIKHTLLVNKVSESNTAANYVTIAKHLLLLWTWENKQFLTFVWVLMTHNNVKTENKGIKTTSLDYSTPEQNVNREKWRKAKWISKIEMYNIHLKLHVSGGGVLYKLIWNTLLVKENL